MESYKSIRRFENRRLLINLLSPNNCFLLTFGKRASICPILNFVVEIAEDVVRNNRFVLN